MPFDGIVTRAVTEELKEEIIPGKITKIYQPTETELVFTVRSQGKNHTLLFSIHPTYARIHVTEDSYTNPKEPPMFCMVLRKHLSGAAIEKIEQYGMERIITFSIKTRNEIGDIAYKELLIELMGKHSNVMLIDKDKGHIIDSLKHVSLAQNRHRIIQPGQKYKLPPMQEKLNPLEISGEKYIKRLDFNAGKLDAQMVTELVGFSPVIAREIVSRANLGTAQVYMEKFLEVQEQIQKNNYSPTIYRNKKEDFHVLPITSFDGEKESFSATNKMLDQFYSGKAERDRVKQQAKDLYRFIKNEKDKNNRKMKKHKQTIKKAEGAKQHQKMGELLTAHMHLVTQGDTIVSVTDYYDPAQNERTIELNPNKSPSENAQAYFKTYQKLKKSKEVIEKEVIKTEEEFIYLDQLLQQIDVASVTDIEEIREELREGGYLKKQSKQKKHKNKPKKPVPEEYTATDGTLILVGKNNKQNEYVTSKLANRNDVWLHTKDIPGSHVVIRSEEPTEDTLIEAAQIAAYFSKSQDSSTVPVDYTKIRHVKKPSGAKPGYVTYDSQKTLFVTPHKNVIDALKKK
ncbi:putative ribosome quality control (RQC) complex YloA/Tae2 family protein [Virgibacillus natechei]|uniref:Rqc2 homolog RqcH n=1 Tax=Virgibacillus natechei TaxID=1216297 RepID=A0ABS4IB53_9BACI|nr:NFACT RNA binding domain-containing protein [Virgibacillus natechei]MBP1968162.1 putative ribosome quality control (RQC) complex YloA/Tae2 family protein [Virgibacillus natechei]UZD14562.1 NFACT family protein [Virgibacillus natechei]